MWPPIAVEVLTLCNPPAATTSLHSEPFPNGGNRAVVALSCDIYVDVRAGDEKSSQYSILRICLCFSETFY